MMKTIYGFLFIGFSLFSCGDHNVKNQTETTQDTVINTDLSMPPKSDSLSADESKKNTFDRNKSEVEDMQNIIKNAK